ncbi:hypothetical protein [Paenibacillus aceti]|uniref:Uncharacterized protein n=1 Tax=Paenibacillus aceti TaxID=1820010 RepID=A0ABQ1W055_9BACL|nr:hypothetical protein [Paenibacillus aceti]GGG04607.1 hypothetical protein GCM10010913_28040 [Paenibacillus aceti]
MISGQMERKDGFLLFLAVIIFIFSGVFYFLWYRPAANESQSLSVKQRETEQFLHKTEQIVKDKRAELQDAATAQQSLDSRQLPVKADQNGVLRDLEAASSHSGVKVVGVSFVLQETPRAESASTGSPESEDSQASAEDFISLLDTVSQRVQGLSAMGVELRVQGTLEEMKEFLAGLHSEERLYVAESMQYAAGKGDEPGVTSLRLRSFYRSTPNA